MCGLVGLWNRNGEPVGAPLLKRMTDLLGHRGPDGEGHFVDGSFGLGHRRLSIIDLSAAGHQPMANETGEIVLVHNGEVYNFQQLRVTLEARGHRFHSQTDSEVVVHAYEEWGEGCVDHFNGMFAFAVWDSRRRSLFMARDRFGVKPLYYHVDADRVIVASEIKAILLHPQVSRRVCYPALNEYFTFQNVLTDLTLFEGIRILPAGTWMRIEAEGEPVLHTYWDPASVDAPLSISKHEAEDELHRLFEQAVTRQLVSDVPVGAYLSGGMDSGSITAVAARHLGRLMTFTCGFDLSSASGLELAFDERANAEVLANLVKSEHYEVVLHAGDMEHVLPELIWHLEDLRIGQSYPNYYAARLASKFVKVVLSGGGGDELFGGYPWRYFRGADSIAHADFYRNYYDFWQRLVSDEDKAEFFGREAYRAAKLHPTFDVFKSVFERTGPTPLTTREDFVKASLYFELKTFLHGLLVVEDKLSMAHSLESRVPFLDNDLVDFALRLPVSYKLGGLNRPPGAIDEDDVGKRRRYEQRYHNGKLVLRDAMKHFIPPEIAKRVKQGFSAPDASWFRGESIEYVNRLLRRPNARIYDFLRRQFVTTRLDEHISGRHNHRLLIWSLLSFEHWLDRFV